MAGFTARALAVEVFPNAGRLMDRLRANSESISSAVVKSSSTLWNRPLLQVPVDEGFGFGLCDLDGHVHLQFKNGSYLVPRRGPGRGYGASHGLRSVTARPAKSFTLRVTSVRPCSRAVAAIWPSGTLSGRPISCRYPSKVPHRSAMDRVTGRMRRKTGSTNPFQAIVRAMFSASRALAV